MYNIAPSVTLIEPDNGKLKGGTRIQILGDGFLTGAEVGFIRGNNFSSATSVNVLTRQLIYATTPQIFAIFRLEFRALCLPNGGGTCNRSS